MQQKSNHSSQQFHNEEGDFEFDPDEIQLGQYGDIDNGIMGRMMESNDMAQENAEDQKFQNNGKHFNYTNTYEKSQSEEQQLSEENQFIVPKKNLLIEQKSEYSPNINKPSKSQSQSESSTKSTYLGLKLPNIPNPHKALLKYFLQEHPYYTVTKILKKIQKLSTITNGLEITRQAFLSYAKKGVRYHQLVEGNKNRESYFRGISEENNFQCLKELQKILKVWDQDQIFYVGECWLHCQRLRIKYIRRTKELFDIKKWKQYNKLIRITTIISQTGQIVCDFTTISIRPEIHQIKMYNLLQNIHKLTHTPPHKKLLLVYTKQNIEQIQNLQLITQKFNFKSYQMPLTLQNFNPVYQFHNALKKQISSCKAVDDIVEECDRFVRKELYFKAKSFVNAAEIQRLVEKEIVTKEQLQKQNMQ